MTALSLLEWQAPEPIACAHARIVDIDANWARCEDCGDDTFPISHAAAYGTAPSPRSSESRFRAWLDANPRVYGEVVRLAREWRAIHGPTSRVGIATLWEHLRWSSGIATTGDDFKLNNTWRAPMARLVMAREPDLAGVFETRGRQ